MDLKIEHKGGKHSKVTISSLGEVRVKIGRDHKHLEKEIVEFAKRRKERLGDVSYTDRHNIEIKNDKLVRR